MARSTPPDDSELIEWPDGFGTRFLATVDVEEEFDWRHPLDRRHRATTAMAAFPDAYRRFADRGVALACLIDYPIATDPAAISILARVVEDGRSEIGTQLHPWVNPPYDERADSAASFAGNLPCAIEDAKLGALTEAIATAFGRPPRMYRAGRYGIGPHTLDLLRARGYRIDSSVRARYDYTDEGGPDFTQVGPSAYRRGGMLELPLTTIFTGRLRGWGGRLHPALGRIPKGRGVFARSELLSRVALTPEDMPIAAAREAVAVAIGEGVRLLNFAFHSPSLAPGHTPYVRDASELRRFHAWWTTMLDDLDRRGIRNASIDEILAVLP